jgi:hypothetical protein
MPALGRKLHVCIGFIVCTISLSAHAQDQCTAAPMAGYALTAESGTPVPEPSTNGFSYTRKNEDNVLVRLENINPYAFKCSVSASTTDVKETAVASFLAFIGGVAGSVGGGGGGTGAAVPAVPSLDANNRVIKKTDS